MQEQIKTIIDEELERGFIVSPVDIVSNAANRIASLYESRVLQTESAKEKIREEIRKYENYLSSLESKDRIDSSKMFEEIKVKQALATAILILELLEGKG